MIYIEQNGSMLKKPISVIKYNKHMSGIDRQDQMTSYNHFERNTLRWYKKIDIHCIHLLLKNYYFLYNKYAKKTSFYDYRLSVIEALLRNNQNILDNNTRFMKKIVCTTFFQKCRKKL